MEIVVVARHTEVPARFRRHMAEKLAKVEQFAPRAHRVEVSVSHEVNKRQAHSCERLEVTVRGKGPVVRAEACAADLYSALDLALDRLLERLRRAGDRRKVHHGRHAPTSVRAATTAALAPPAGGEVGPAGRGAELDGAAADVGAVAAPGPDGGDGDGDGDGEGYGDSPVVIRHKEHPARPMSLDDALAEMELVGHDFYLFVDAATGRPSVVYRRRGWNYGCIHLVPDDAAAAEGRPAGGAAVADGAAPAPLERSPATV